MEVQFSVFDVFDDFIEISMHAFICFIFQEIDLLDQFEVGAALGMDQLLEIPQL